MDTALEQFNISVAGHTAAIAARHEELVSLCRDFLCTLPEEFTIRITPEDLEHERSEAGRTGGPQEEELLESQAACRKLSETMLAYDTFLIHGAAVAAGDGAYLFTAASGTGKTTHLRKWLQQVEGAEAISGDRPMIRLTDTQAIVCGTPWRGRERLGSGRMAPLKAIVLMERGENNSIEEISFSRAFTFLLQQTYRPTDPEKMRRTLALLSRLKGKVRFYRFICNNMKSDAFDVAFGAIGDSSLVRRPKPAPVPARTVPPIPRSFAISVAGQIVGIDSLYADIYSLCRDFLTDLTPEMRIRITQEDLDLERTEGNRPYSASGRGYLETLAVCRKLSEEMLSRNTFLMHGAVVAVGRDAYMFTAASGTGKTTHILKWLRQAEGAFAVNGDKPLIRIEDDRVIACGTPWRGKEQMGTNTQVPLRAIVLMERGEKNRIREISFAQAFTFLLQQTYRPSDPEKMEKTLALLSQLSGRLRFWRFSFDNMQDDAFEVAYLALTGEPGK